MILCFLFFYYYFFFILFTFKMNSDETTFYMWGKGDIEYRTLTASWSVRVKGWGKDEVYFANHQDEFFAFGDRIHHFVKIYIKKDDKYIFLGWMNAIIVGNEVHWKNGDDKIYDFRAPNSKFYYWTYKQIGDKLYFGYYLSPYTGYCDPIEDLPSTNPDDYELKPFLYV